MMKFLNGKALISSISRRTSENAKGNVSEKSFYTYFKTPPTAKLPRIDMLNILS